MNKTLITGIVGIACTFVALIFFSGLIFMGPLSQFAQTGHVSFDPLWFLGEESVFDFNLRFMAVGIATMVWLLGFIFILFVGIKKQKMKRNPDSVGNK